MIQKPSPDSQHLLGECRMRSGLVLSALDTCTCSSSCLYCSMSNTISQNGICEIWRPLKRKLPTSQGPKIKLLSHCCHDSVESLISTSDHIIDMHTGHSMVFPLIRRPSAHGSRAQLVNPCWISVGDTNVRTSRFSQTKQKPNKNQNTQHTTHNTNTNTNRNTNTNTDTNTNPQTNTLTNNQNNPTTKQPNNRTTERIDTRHRKERSVNVGANHVFCVRSQNPQLVDVSGTLKLFRAGSPSASSLPSGSEQRGNTGL